VSEAGADASLVLDLDLFGDDPWVATLGSQGFRRHGSELTESGVSDVVVGAGIETMRVHFDEPRAVRGRLVESRLRLSTAVGDDDALGLQLRFREEVTQANLLRDQAREAEADGHPARALLAWSELLDRVPFQGELVREAEEERSRLVQQGLASIAAVRRDVVGARFFSVPELFRAARRRALHVADAYHGTEVERAARELIGEIAGELHDFDTEQERLHRLRLQAVLDSSAVAGTTVLSGRLRRALDGIGRDPGADAGRGDG